MENNTYLEMKVMHINKFEGKRKRDDEPFTCYTFIGTMANGECGAVKTYRANAGDVARGDLIKLEPVARPGRFGVALELDFAGIIEQQEGGTQEEHDN